MMRMVEMSYKSQYQMRGDRLHKYGANAAFPPITDKCPN
jgi:hypothetical protein